MHDCARQFLRDSPATSASNSRGPSTLTADQVQIDGLAKAYTATGQRALRASRHDGRCRKRHAQRRRRTIWICEGNVHIVQGDRTMIAEHVSGTTRSRAKRTREGNVDDAVPERNQPAHRDAETDQDQESAAKGDAAAVGKALAKDPMEPTLFGAQMPQAKASREPQPMRRSRRACVRVRSTSTLDKAISSVPGARCGARSKRDRVPSMILWGPPGTGKTTLAEIVARFDRCAFRAALGGERRRRGSAQGRRGSASANDASGQRSRAVHRRDPSIQQSAARRGACRTSRTERSR